MTLEPKGAIVISDYPLATDFESNRDFADISLIITFIH